MTEVIQDDSTLVHNVPICIRSAFLFASCQGSSQSHPCTITGCGSRPVIGLPQSDSHTAVLPSYVQIYFAYVTTRLVRTPYGVRLCSRPITGQSHNLRLCKDETGNNSHVSPRAHGLTCEL